MGLGFETAWGEVTLVLFTTLAPSGTASSAPWAAAMRGSSVRVGSCHRGSAEAVIARDSAGTQATAHAAARRRRVAEAVASSSESASAPTAARSGSHHRLITSSNEQAAMGTSTAL